jgi:hypothetical protein
MGQIMSGNVSIRLVTVTNNKMGWFKVVLC